MSQDNKPGMRVLHTKLRVSYDTCMRHISKNLRGTLKVHIVKHDTPDVVDILPLEAIRNMAITHMEQGDCNGGECLSGTMFFNNGFYRFCTHQKSYDVVIVMEKMIYPFNKLKIILPITSYSNPYDTNTDNTCSKIYIPPEYTSDAKTIPIEFVWEFLSQLPMYIDDSVGC